MAEESDLEEAEPVAELSATPFANNPSWQRVQLARHPKRPHSIDYIKALLTRFEEIHGDRFYGDDPSMKEGL
jgi:acetyl-CoA carboxylase carboxyl transferase subunit alpha